MPQNSFNLTEIESNGGQNGWIEICSNIYQEKTFYFDEIDDHGFDEKIISFQ